MSVLISIFNVLARGVIQGTREKIHYRKVLNFADVILFTISSVLITDQLTKTVSIGQGALFWWILIAFTFFIPACLITAELGVRFPRQGGLALWIGEAFGEVWSARIAWYNWLSTALWLPSAYLLVTEIMNFITGSNMPLFVNIILCLILTWFGVFTDIMNLAQGKWLPNIGAITRVLCFVLIIVLGMVAVLGFGMENHLTSQDFIPHFGDTFSHVAFISTIVVNFVGFELASAASKEIMNTKTISRMIFITGMIIVILYFLGNISMLMIMPRQDLDITVGPITLITTALKGITGGGISSVILSWFMALLLIVTSITNVNTWSLGTNRSTMAAANLGLLPRFFASYHPTYKTPYGSAIANGITSSAILIFYWIISSLPEGKGLSGEDIFWEIFIISSIPFMLPYFPLFLSLPFLRKKYPHFKKNIFIIPGGKFTLWFLVSIACFWIVFAIIGFYLDSDIGSIPLVIHILTLVIGTLAMIIAGELMIKRAMRMNRKLIK